MPKFNSKITLLLAMSAISSQLWASGVQINEQSTSTMGTAFAGRASSALDASTIYGNPAGMSLLDGEQMSIGGTIVQIHSKLSKTSASTGRIPYRGTHSGDMTPTAVVPHAYYVKPLNEQWSVGFGLYAPFASETNYSNRFEGQRYGKTSRVQVITAQPSVSFKPNDQWSFGLGITANRAEGLLTNTINTRGLPGFNSKLKSKAHDFAWGYNVGTIFQPVEGTRIGLDWHSKVAYRLHGHTKVRYQPQVLKRNPAYRDNKERAVINFTSPETAEISLTQKINDQWTGYASYNWTRWNRLQSVDVQTDAIKPTTGRTQVSEKQNWHNTKFVTGGLSYQWDSQWVVRGGIGYDETPTNNHDRGPRIPDNDRWMGSMGLGYNYDDNLSFDLAYMYLHLKEAKVNKNEPGKGTFKANYHTNANLLSGQANWKF